MSHPLDGPRAKVERAKEHLDTLKRETAPLRGRLHYGKDYSVFSEFDPTTRKFGLRLRVLRPAPLLRFGILVGDVVHQCRSALDNLIEQATIAHSGAALPGTEFPVFSDPSAYGQLITKGGRKGQPVPGSGLYAVRGIFPGAQAGVERLQPYNRDASRGPGPLSVLHDFWNMDKHRVPPVVATSTLASYPKVTLQGAPGGSRDWYLMMMFPFEDGVNLIEGVLLSDETPQQIESSVKVQLSSDIEFGDGPLGTQTGRRYPVVGVLEEAIKFAEAVIQDFSPFFPAVEQVAPS